MKPRAWRRLHRAVYLIAVMGVIHYFLLVKADTSSPLLYGAIVAALLAARIPLRALSGAPRSRPVQQ
jgi:sulfoxide reductase heme-binding subunit YedZ